MAKGSSGFFPGTSGGGAGDEPRINTTTDKRLSTKGEPNSITRQIDSNGKVISERYYGSDGRAIKDIDYTNHGNPKTHPNVPHEHTWEWSNPDAPVRSR